MKRQAFEKYQLHWCLSYCFWLQSVDKDVSKLPYLIFITEHLNTPFHLINMHSCHKVSYHSVFLIWQDLCTHKLTGVVIVCTRLESDKGSQHLSMYEGVSYMTPPITKELLARSDFLERKVSFLWGYWTYSKPVLQHMSLYPGVYGCSNGIYLIILKRRHEVSRRLF